MTARLTIGRVAGPFDENIESIKVDGRTVSIGGLIGRDRDAADATRVPFDLFDRDQIRQLVDNPDEQFYVCTFADDPTLNGVYTVTRSTVDIPPAALEIGHFKYDVDLELVSDQVVVESTLIGGFRTNNAGYTNAQVWPTHAVPDDALTYWDGESSLGGIGSFTRTLESGDLMRVHRLAVPGGREYRPGYSLDPADAYIGAADIERKINGTTWLPSIGRMLPASATWRLNNHKVRASLSPTAGALIRLELWDQTASTWRVHDFNFGADGASLAATDVRTVTVLRSAADRSAIRLGIRHPLYKYTAIVDLVLVRGETFLRVHATQEDGYVGHNWGASPTSGSAPTDLLNGGTKYGVRETTAANSCRWYIFSPQALTTGVGIYAEATGILDFDVALGIQRTADASSTGEQHPDLVKQYFAPMAEQMSAVGR